jgi:hypothetical protein
MIGMRPSSGILAISLIAAFFVGPSSARGDQCRLTEIASIDLAATPDGVPLVPVKLNGIDEKLWLDFEDPFSYLASDLGPELVSEQTDVPFPDNDVVPNGSQLKYIVFKGRFRATTVPSIQIGTITGKNVLMYSGPDRKSMNGVAGAIGLSLLGNYDVELDLSKNKLNLFDQNHCPGQVVYGTHTPVGVVAMLPMPGGTYQYEFKLDGTTLGAFITADQMETLFAFPVAREDLGLTRTSSDVTYARQDEWGHKLYRYPFQSLDADGLTISKPEVYLTGDEYFGKICDSRLHARTVDNESYRCIGDADLKIGVHELRALHLFFAFSEKKLYVTAAGAN